MSQNYKDAHPGTHPEKCDSFFKVGGGFRAEDYANIKHKTDGYWNDWDRNNPPDEYITLGGGARQFERPDVWIKPSESIVVEAKAASIAASDQFATGFTLRFPRFKRIREDKTWATALSYDEFLVLKKQAEDEPRNDRFQIDGKRRVGKKLKKELVIAGNDQKVKTQYAGPNTKVLDGLNFCVLTDMLKPQKKSKPQIEQIIKANGGNIFQSVTARENMICIGEKRVIKVAAVMKGGQTNVVKPAWIFDALKQNFLVPFEPGHMFHVTEASKEEIEANVDIYGDSYTRDCTAQELKTFFGDMILPKHSEFVPQEFVTELHERGKGEIGESKASIFRSCVVRFLDNSCLDTKIAKHQFQFAGGIVAETDDDDESLTHFVIQNGDNETPKALRKKVAGLGRRKIPRIVTLSWLTDSWNEGTLLDEERYSNCA